MHVGRPAENLPRPVDRTDRIVVAPSTIVLKAEDRVKHIHEAWIGVGEVSTPITRLSRTDQSERGDLYTIGMLAMSRMRKCLTTYVNQLTNWRGI
jgi:hypothetical protein